MAPPAPVTLQCTPRFNKLVCYEVASKALASRHILFGEKTDILRQCLLVPATELQLHLPGSKRGSHSRGQASSGRVLVVIGLYPANEVLAAGRYSAVLRKACCTFLHARSRPLLIRLLASDVLDLASSGLDVSQLPLFALYATTDAGLMRAANRTSGVACICSATSSTTGPVVEADRLVGRFSSVDPHQKSMCTIAGRRRAFADCILPVCS